MKFHSEHYSGKSTAIRTFCTYVVGFNILTSVTSSFAASTFHLIGTFDDKPPLVFDYPFAFPLGLSSDGGIVLAKDGFATSWTWQQQTGFEANFQFSDGSGQAHAISGDGTTVVGQKDGIASLWRRNTGIMAVPLPPGTTGSTAEAVSYDGNVIGGSVKSETEGERPAIWTPTGTMIIGDVQGRITGLSRDGSVAAIYSSSDESYIWSETHGLTQVDMTIPSGTIFFAGVSADGSVVTGRTNHHAAYWTAESGVVDLGALPEFQHALPHGISADGTVIVGELRNIEGPQEDSFDSAAFVWDAAHGMRVLEDVLRDEFGLSDLHPAGLADAVAISDDLRTILGGSRLEKVNASNVGEVWVITLDRPLVVTSGVVGDFDGDGALGIRDIDLLAAEIQSDRNVVLFDVDGNGRVYFDDLSFWITGLAKTYFGDANLDGEFNSGDLVTVFAQSYYEADAHASWSQGDWNGDGKFTTQDLVLAFTDGGYERGKRPAAHPVPEPRAAYLQLVAFGFVAMGVLASRERPSICAGPRA